jgi:hypothetical protein
MPGSNPIKGPTPERLDRTPEPAQAQTEGCTCDLTQDRFFQGDALLHDVVLGIAVVIATFAGPIFAVLMTRHIDKVRLMRERRENIFRTLMATRRTLISPEKAVALNMVEIEFYGIQSVQEAHREVMAHINAPRPLPDNWGDRHRALLTRLLSEIAQVLGYKLQQLDVLEGGYYPQGLADMEVEQQAVRRALIEVLSGRRPLGVSPAAPAPPAPFPPPPIAVNPTTPPPPSIFPPPPPNTRGT